MTTLPTENQVNYQKQLIGEFIILFENLNGIVRFIIPKIIFTSSITERQNKNIETLLEQLTFSPLLNKFDSLIADNYSDFQRLITLNKELSIKSGKLLEIRNTIAHGSYRLGWRDFDGNLSSEYFSLMRSKSTKSGFEKRSMIISINSIEDLIKQVRDLNNSYFRISSIITFINLNQDISAHLDCLENEIHCIKVTKIKYEVIKN